MKRKAGFTLIEIMVVIIIIGVLATIGVPKLFGFIAKAKAAEVPVAAGSYVSLQEAFVSEEIAIGSWNLIGYAAPGNSNVSNYFKYGQGCITENIDNEDFTENIVGWTARNLASLNSCKENSVWGITLSPSENKKISYGYIGTDVNCVTLTANFKVGYVNDSECPVKTVQSSSSTAKSVETPQSSAQAASSAQTAASSSSVKCNNGNDKDNCGNGQLKDTSSSASIASSSSTGELQCNNGNNKQNCGNGQLKKLSSAAAATESSNSTESTPTSDSGDAESGDTGNGNGSGSGSGGGKAAAETPTSESSTIEIPASYESENYLVDEDGNKIDDNKLGDEVCAKVSGFLGLGLIGGNCTETIPKSDCETYSFFLGYCTKTRDNSSSNTTTNNSNNNSAKSSASNSGNNYGNGNGSGKNKKKW